MLIEVAGRAEATVKEMLNVAHAGGTSTGELRDVLAVTKRIAAVVATVQTHLASAVAVTERHGDGGTEVLAETTGLTRREARGQVKTAKTIAGVPSVRDAVAQGRVSLANAKRLADAVERTSAGAVEADGGLLKMAESLRAEQFTKEARRWIAEQQDDGGEADHQRMRAKRCVRVWDNDNGMVELHGTFDPLTGKRIGNRLRAEANRLYQNDKKHATLQDQHERGNQQQDETNGQRHKEADNNRRDSTPNGSRSGSHQRSRAPGNSKASDRRRSFDQCMADALDNLTSNTVTTPSPSTDSGSAARTGTTGRTAETTISNGHRARGDTNSTDTGTVIGNGNVGETGTENDAGSDAEATTCNGHRACGDTNSTDTGTVIGNGNVGETGTENDAGSDAEATISNGQRACAGTSNADAEMIMGHGEVGETGTENDAGSGTGATISNGHRARGDTLSADTGTVIGNGEVGETGTENDAGSDAEATISNGHRACAGTSNADAEMIMGNGDVGETGTGSTTGSGTGATISNGHRARGDTLSADTGTVIGNDEVGGVGNGSDAGFCAECGTDNRANTSADSQPGLGRAFADICVIVQVDAVTGELVAQLPDGERLPASVLDKLTCNARISVILSTAKGQPIWRAIAARAASDTQRRLLLARWGGCFHCAAHPAMCQIHHIVPVAQGGETKIDNLIPVCWDCHDLIHHNHWQIHKHPKGNHTLHPPDPYHHGPAHAPEQPLLFTSADHDHGSAHGD